MKVILSIINSEPDCKAISSHVVSAEFEFQLFKDNPKIAIDTLNKLRVELDRCDLNNS